MSRQGRESRDSARGRGPDDRFGVAFDRNSVEKFARIMARLREEGRCNLCGHPADFLGVLVPGAELQRLLLAPSGSLIQVPISFCRACRDEPGMKARFEAILIGMAETYSRQTDLN
jgi:hypothetical protein